MSATDTAIQSASSTVTNALAATSSNVPQFQESEVDDEALVFYVNLFLASLIIFLILVRSRRILARLHSVNEWTSGIFLRSVRTASQQSPRLRENSSYPTIPSSGYDFATDDSHSFYTHTTRPSGRATPSQYPPHVPSCPRFFRPVVLALQYRIADGVTLSQLLAQAVWLSVLVFATFYSAANPFVDPVRIAWVSVSQMPFLFLFSAKNSVPGMLLGFGYERLNFMHRFLGYIVVLSANIHGIDYFYKWLLTATFSQNIVRPVPLSGLIALVCFDCLFFFSRSWWRQKSYGFFMVTHFLGYAGVFPALWFHQSSLRPWLIACLVVIAFDRLFRVLKTRITYARLRPMPDLGMTRIECKSINAGWRAGQHVRIRVLNGNLGIVGWFFPHPFTIASISTMNGGNEGEGLVLFCKKTKKSSSWTSRLFELAQSGHNDAEKRDYGRFAPVTIEGPYGGPGVSMFASFSGVILVVGGSGITYGLSVMEDLVQKDLLGKSRVKSLELVWIVPDAAALVPLIPVFTSLIRQSSPSTNSDSYTSLKISVFYTRAPIGQFPFADNFFEPYHPKLTLSPGRPKVGKLVEGVMSKIVRLGSGVKDHEKNTGVAVGVCGPVELVDEVNGVVANLDEERRNQVGGVEVVEEVFGV